MRLDFINDGLSLEGCKFLAQGLEECKFLKVLTLSYNPIGDEGLEVLVAAMRKHEGIEGALSVLDVEGCGIGSKGMAALTTWIATQNCFLQELNLKGNYQIGITAIGQLFVGVKLNNSITTLNLHDTFKQRNIEPEAAEEFRNALKEMVISHPTLSILDFTGNAIDSEEGVMLHAALQMNQNLASIKVDRDLGEMFNAINLLSEENTAAIAKAKAKAGKKKKKK